MIRDFHKVCFGDFEFFRRRLEVLVRLLHAHDPDDLSTVLFKIGSKCFQERLTELVASTFCSTPVLGD
jgi:hypothetical protein